MTFLSTKQTPPAARYACMVRDAFPGAAVDVVPAILGDGVRALVGHGAVVLTLAVSHAQGHRGPVPVTAVSARVPTRGAVLTLGPAASIPASAKAPRPPRVRALRGRSCSASSRCRPSAPSRSPRRSC